MSPSQSSCPHDHRPGTTVCLHCRHAERVAARARRRVLYTRGGAAAVVMAVAGAAVIAAATGLQARRDHGAARTAQKAHDTAVVPDWSSQEASIQQAGQPAAPADSPSVRRDSIALQAAPSPKQQASAAAPLVGPSTASAPVRVAPTPIPQGAPVVPVVAEGRTELRDGMYAERKGGMVYVHFDTPLTRTRRRDKLEQLVRNTLPTVFGAAVDSALSRIPAGQLTNGLDPVTELPAKGMWVPLRNGWALAVWPETRPGQDGPLVVTYRATLMR